VKTFVALSARLLLYQQINNCIEYWYEEKT